MFPRSLIPYAVGLSTCSLLFAGVATAQIIPDSTLGGDSSQVVPGASVRGLPAELIEGGAVRGSNLFHSFSEFNVNELQRVYFANPESITDILSRVTGGNESDILGTLGVDGSANLFLLNPQGIFFGPDAQLDIAGSFTASTGDAWVLGEGEFFSAVNPGDAPLLLTTITPGIQYSPAQRAIENQASLAVGEDLTLAAGTLDLQGQLRAGGNLELLATDTLTIRDRATAPFVAAAGNNLLVQGDQAVDIFALNNPGSGLWSGNGTTLRSSNTVAGDARYYTGGDFRVEGLTENTAVGLASPSDPVIEASGNVFLPFYQGASLHILAGGSVEIPGYVWIQGADPDNGLPTETVQLDNGASVVIAGRTTPTLDIRAGIAQPVPVNTVTGAVNNLDFPLPAPAERADIRIGTILLAAEPFDIQDGTGNSPLAGTILLTNQYQANPALPGDIEVSSTLNTGDPQTNVLERRAVVNGDLLTGGLTEIHSRGNITIDGVINAGPSPFISTLFNQVNNVSLNGPGGDVRLTSVGDITFTPTSGIDSTGTVGGDITLLSGGTIQLSGIDEDNGAGISSFSVGTEFNPGAQGGTIDIRANQVLLDNYTNIISSVLPLALLSPLADPTEQAQANAGDITIQGDTLISVTNNSQIRAAIERGGQGEPGVITLQGGSLNVGRSQVGSFLARGGRAVYFDGNGGRTFSDAIFPGGIGTNTESKDTVIVNMADSVVISGVNDNGFSAGLFALTERSASGLAGNIAIDAALLRVEDGAGISSLTFNEGNAGIIVATVNRFEALDGGRILTNTLDSGNAGGIAIEADSVLIRGVEENFQGRIELIDTYLNENVDQPGVPGPELAEVNRLDVLGLVTANSGLYVSTDGGSVNNVPDFSTFGSGPISGNAGIALVLAETVSLEDKGLILATTSTDANGGFVGILAQELDINSGAEILALTTGSGQAGDIFIGSLDETRPSRITIDGFAPITPADGVFDNLLDFPEGGFSSGIFAGTEDGFPNDPDVLSQGTGGNVLLATDVLTLSNAGVISARTRSAGDSGDVLVNVGELNILSGGQILASTYSEGAAGDLFVNVVNDATISGLDPDRQARFDALVDGFQTAEIDTPNPILPFREPITDVTVARERTQAIVDTVRESSGLFSTVEFGAENEGGDINFIVGGSLVLDDFGQIAVGTSGIGDAGAIAIDVENDLRLSGGSTIRALVESNGRGDGGNVEVDANSVLLTEGAQISASIFRETELPDGTIVPGGNATRAGNITINADTDVTVSGTGVDLQGGTFRSALLVSTEAGGTGEAGSIRVNADTLNLLEGGFVSARTDNQSNAGNIELNIAESLTLTGGGTADTDSVIEVLSSEANADPGNILIASGLPEEFIDFSDPAFFSTVTPDSFQPVGLIDLENGGKIRATTQSGRNANIVIFSNFIDMRQPNTVPQSALLGDLETCTACNNISTTALGGQGNGGNIFIGTLAGVRANLDENSDIVADARGQGAGGNIVIGSLASSFLGTGSRTSSSRLAFEFLEGREPTNQSDLFASSRLGQDGTTEVDGQENVQELPPIDLVDPVGLIDRRCELTASNTDSQFVVTGRGGIPASPADQLSEGELLEDLGPEAAVSQAAPSTGIAEAPPEYVVEAQGWSVDENGDYWLVAAAPAIQDVQQHSIALDCSADTASSN